MAAGIQYTYVVGAGSMYEYIDIHWCTNVRWLAYWWAVYVGISLGVGKLHGGTLGIMPEPQTVDSLGLQVVGSWPAALNRSVVVGPSRQLSGGEVQLGHSDQAGQFTMDDDVVEDSPFVISEGLPPVPVKLVKKILTLESELV